MPKPLNKPQCPYFGSGPTRKYPGWNLNNLPVNLLGRSHRSIGGKTKLQELIDRTRQILQIPDDYRIAIMAGSATGAFECALWSLLGERGIDLLAFDVFGYLWVMDVLEQLKLTDVHVHKTAFGEALDLSVYDSSRDCVFTWNGTTSGLCIPNGDWIDDNREGLTLCDATSAAFCVPLPWQKLDVTAYSWQKGLGGEAAHGMLVLSPRAVERLTRYTPIWPIPRVFRLVNGKTLNEGLFRGETLNTPSMLCVEDHVDALLWAEKIGGLPALQKRCQDNFKAIVFEVENTPWLDFVSKDLRYVSPASVCLEINTPAFKKMEEKEQRDWLRSLAKILADEGAAFDIVNHAYAPPSLRVWAGPTVETRDLQRLFEWLRWAVSQI